MALEVLNISGIEKEMFLSVAIDQQKETRVFFSDICYVNGFLELVYLITD